MKKTIPILSSFNLNKKLNTFLVAKLNIFILLTVSCISFTLKAAPAKIEKTTDKKIANASTDKETSPNTQSQVKNQKTPVNQKAPVKKNTKNTQQKNTVKAKVQVVKTNKKNKKVVNNKNLKKAPVKKAAIRKTQRKAPAKKAPVKIKPFYTKAQQQLLDEFQKLIPKKIAIIDGKEITPKEFFEFFINSLPGRRPPAHLTIHSAPYLFAINAENIVNSIILDKHLSKLKIVPNEKETFEYYKNIILKLSPSEKQILEERLKRMRITSDNYLKRLSSDKNIQKEICHHNYFQKEFASKINIPEQECRNYYNQNSRRFQFAEHASVSILRISYNPRKKGDKDSAKKKITSIHSQLVKNPKLFEKLVKLHSDCSSKENNGKIGLVYKSMLHKNIDKVLFTMSNNKISSPLEANNAFYIIRCDTRYGARTLSYNETKAQILEFLRQEKMHLKINEFFVNLRKKHKVQIFIKMPPYKDVKMEIPSHAKFK